MFDRSERNRMEHEMNSRQRAAMAMFMLGAMLLFIAGWSEPADSDAIQLRSTESLMEVVLIDPGEYDPTSWREWKELIRRLELGEISEQHVHKLSEFATRRALSILTHPPHSDEYIEAIRTRQAADPAFAMACGNYDSWGPDRWIATAIYSGAISRAFFTPIIRDLFDIKISTRARPAAIPGEVHPVLVHAEIPTQVGDRSNPYGFEFYTGVESCTLNGAPIELLHMSPGYPEDWKLTPTRNWTYTVPYCGAIRTVALFGVRLPADFQGGDLTFTARVGLSHMNITTMIKTYEKRETWIDPSNPDWSEMLVVRDITTTIRLDVAEPESLTVVVDDDPARAPEHMADPDARWFGVEKLILRSGGDVKDGFVAPEFSPKPQTCVLGDVSFDVYVSTDTERRLLGTLARGYQNTYSQRPYVLWYVFVPLDFEQHELDWLADRVDLELVPNPELAEELPWLVRIYGHTLHIKDVEVVRYRGSGVFP
jgi:hypothetical protein